MSVSASPSDPAPRRIPRPLVFLGHGWMLFCAAYVLAATALDASFYAHYEGKYAYWTPLRRADLIEMLRHFRITDLRLDWSVPFALLPVVTVLLLLLRPIRRRPVLFLCMSLPFTPVWRLVPAV